MAAVSAGADDKAYMALKLPSSREAHVKPVALSLEAANAVLPCPLCAGPMLFLLATLTIFKATLDSNSMAPKDKEQVSKVSNYLAK